MCFAHTLERRRSSRVQPSEMGEINRRISQIFWACADKLTSWSEAYDKHWIPSVENVLTYLLPGGIICQERILNESRNLVSRPVSREIEVFTERMTKTLTELKLLGFVLWPQAQVMTIGQDLVKRRHCYNDTTNIHWPNWPKPPGNEVGKWRGIGYGRDKPMIQKSGFFLGFLESNGIFRKF